MANDVLTLKLDPRPEKGTAGGKSRSSIKGDRLGLQTLALSQEAQRVTEGLAQQPVFGGRTHIIAWMFDDSLAATHAPNDLFALDAGFALVAPLGKGYLIEAELSALAQLRERILQQANVRIQADISRVRSVELFNGDYAFHGLKPEALWEHAVAREQGRLFFLWLTPCKSPEARTGLLRSLQTMRNSSVLLPTPRTSIQADAAGTSIAPPRPDSIATAEFAYRQRGTALFAAQIKNVANLITLVASGTVVRIDPARPVHVAAPGEGEEPTPVARVGSEPIVAVVDGGRNARSYDSSEVWRATPFVSDGDADIKHGNAIVSLVVNGHAWNNNRPLPQLDCRVGIVQAVAKPGAATAWDELSLLEYLGAVAKQHPEAKVWNISANQDPLGTGRVSVLGDGISRLARAAGIIPVVSIGNVKNGDRRLQPPADSEAALVVGGRQANADGSPGAACPVCVEGWGPEGMLKPDVSWFSNLRFLGGRHATGSSYAAAITAPLTAHAVARLRDADPDLVKALLIHATDGKEPDRARGWGTPFNGHLPWECAPGTITLAFRAAIKPGFAFYWDIPMPPGLIQTGKLKGGFKLTAILKPLLSPVGLGNYFSSRLQTNLQYQNGKGDFAALLGNPRESEIEERAARDDYQKWQPVRHFPLTHVPNGKTFTGATLRLYAQVFLRDNYQYPWTGNADAPEQQASFVLSFVSPDNDTTFYNTTFSSLGNIVETAVLAEVETNIEHGDGTTT